MKKTQWVADSLIGKLYLVASERGLSGIYWKKQNIPFAKSLKVPGADVKHLAKTERELKEYFAGQRTNFSIPLDAQGTPFQKSVWNALSEIPYGKTRSYRDIALRIKNPKAVRAVGNANGKNPVSIIVPCHRVIASSGMLGGYAGGLRKKSTLLELEQKQFSK